MKKIIIYFVIIIVLFAITCLVAPFSQGATANQNALSNALAISGCKGAWVFDSSTTIHDSTNNSQDGVLHANGTPPASWSMDEYGGSFNMHGTDNNGIVIPPGHALHTPYFTIVMTLKPSSVIDWHGCTDNYVNRNLFYLPYSTYGGDPLGNSAVLLCVYVDVTPDNPVISAYPQMSRVLNILAMPNQSWGVGANSNGWSSSLGGYIPGTNQNCKLPMSDYPVTFMVAFDSTGFTFRVKSKDDYQVTYAPITEDNYLDYGNGLPTGGVVHSGDSIINLDSAEWGENQLGGAMTDKCYNTFYYNKTLSEAEFLSIANSYYGTTTTRISGNINLKGVTLK